MSSPERRQTWNRDKVFGSSFNTFDLIYYSFSHPSAWEVGVRSAVEGRSLIALLPAKLVGPGRHLDVGEPKVLTLVLVVVAVARPLLTGALVLQVVNVLGRGTV